MKLAKRMANLGTETAFEVLARAKALEAKGKDVIHLEIGEPDFETPGNVVEAGIRALREGFTHYTPSAGMPEMRKAIAEEVSRTRGLDFGPDEVVVCPGAKPIMFFAILALVDEGDEVVYPNPGFPIYESMIRFVGAKPVPVRLPEEKDFRLDVDGLARAITKKTRLVIINSPHNPTGGILEPEDLARIAEAVKGVPDCWVLSDEIYRRIVYAPGEHPSISAIPGMRERTIVLDGFSKAYAMTGWRLGYGVMPKDLATSVTRLMTNSNSCTAAFTQRAGVEALAGDQTPVLAMVEEFAKRRDAIVAGMNTVKGFRCRSPKGAFYVFPNVSGTGRKSKDLETAILDEAGVACLSGTSFGAFGEGYLRFSYANSLENIEKAVSRLRELLGSA